MHALLHVEKLRFLRRGKGWTCSWVLTMFLLIMSLSFKLFIFVHFRGFYDLWITTKSGVKNNFHNFSHHFLSLNGSLNISICYIDHCFTEISKNPNSEMVWLCLSRARHNMHLFSKGNRNSLMRLTWFLRVEQCSAPGSISLTFYLLYSFLFCYF